MQRKNFLLLSLHIPVLVGFAIAQPIYDLLTIYPEFFVAGNTQPPDIYTLVLVISLLLGAVLVLPQVLVEYIKRGSGQYIHYVLLSALSSLLVLVVLRKMDLNTGSLSLVLAIAVGAGTGFLYFKYETLRKYVTILLPAVVIFPVVFIAQEPVQKILSPQNSQTISPQAVQKSLPTVVFVIFDEINVTDLMVADHSIDKTLYPNFAKLSETSYWFRNATTVSSMTMTAIPAILTGRYVEEKKRALPIYRDYPDNLFVAFDATHNLNVLEGGTRLCPSDLCKSKARKTSDFERLSKLFGDISILYLNMIVPDRFGYALPDISQKWFDFGTSKQAISVTESKVPKKTGNVKITEKSVNKDFVSRLRGDRPSMYSQFVETIEKRETPTFHYLHILFPHAPFVYLPSGKHYGDHSLDGLKKKKWGDDRWAVNLGWQRSLMQLVYTDTLLGELLDHLEDNAIMDDVILIVTADHGSNYSTNEFRRILGKGNFHNLSPVPLFVKLQNQKQGVVSDTEVEVIDIPATLQDLVGIQLPFETSGESVFKTKGRKTKTVYRNRGSINYEFSSSSFDKKYETLAERLALFPVDSGLSGLFYLGPSRSLRGHEIADYSIERSAGRSISIVEPAGLMLERSTTEQPGFIKGHIRGKEQISTPYDIVLAVNNRIVSGTKTLQPGQDGEHVFVLLVPASAYANDENQLNIYTVGRAGDGKVYLEAMPQAGGG